MSRNEILTEIFNDSLYKGYAASFYPHLADELVSEMINCIIEVDFEKLSEDQWHQMFDVNVHGLYYCAKIVVPDMKKQGNGYIINVGSIAGTTAVKNMVGYAATKHAVTGISHSLFMELREYGIKVSCIYPGSVKTNFFDKITSIEAHDNMMMPEDIAGSIIHLLESSPNYHMVDIEMRPLKPKG